MRSEYESSQNTVEYAVNLLLLQPARIFQNRCGWILDLLKHHGLQKDEGPGRDADLRKDSEKE